MPHTIPGTILTSSSNWGQGQSPWEGLSDRVRSLQHCSGNGVVGRDALAEPSGTQLALGRSL